MVVYGSSYTYVVLIHLYHAVHVHVLVYARLLVLSSSFSSVGFHFATQQRVHSFGLCAPKSWRRGLLLRPQQRLPNSPLQKRRTVDSSTLNVRLLRAHTLIWVTSFSHPAVKLMASVRALGNSLESDKELAHAIIQQLAERAAHSRLDAPCCSKQPEKRTRGQHLCKRTRLVLVASTSSAPCKETKTDFSRQQQRGLCGSSIRGGTAAVYSISTIPTTTLLV